MNDVKLQEGHPVDENLRPIKVGGKSTSIETAQHGNGARINGDLEVTGNIKGNIKDRYLDPSIITGDLSAPLTGVVAANNGSDAIEGTGTAFTTELVIGDAIKVQSDVTIGYEIFTVDAITDDDTLSVDSNYAGTNATGLWASKDPNLLTIRDGDGTDEIVIDKAGNIVSTDLTIDDSGDITLDAGGGDVNILQADLTIPVDKKVILGNTGEYIVGDDTDLDIVSSNDITLTATRDLKLDATRNIIYNSDGGFFDFTDSDTAQLQIDVNSTAGDIDINLKVDGDDLVFNQYDGGEIIRFTDGGDVKVTNTIYFAAETANTIADGATGAIDWNVSQKQKLTITGTGITVNFTNPAGACNVLLRVVQGDGSDVIGTWDADIKWSGGSAPTLSTGNGEIDILSFYWDGTKYYGIASLDFS